MLTVLHRYNGGSTEVVYEAIEVCKQESATRAKSGEREFDLHVTLAPDHPAQSVTIPISSGPRLISDGSHIPDCAIVMNQHGKTVAKYDL